MKQHSNVPAAAQLQQMQCFILKLFLGNTISASTEQLVSETATKIRNVHDKITSLLSSHGQLPDEAVQGVAF